MPAKMADRYSQNGSLGRGSATAHFSRVQAFSNYAAPPSLYQKMTKEVKPEKLIDKARALGIGKRTLQTWLELGCPNGTAFTDFLGSLNSCSPAGSGFAGHCDWRLPTLEELLTISDPSLGECNGGTGPCIDPIFGPTIDQAYWTVTTANPFPSDFANVVNFGNYIAGLSKDGVHHVRAVRRGD